MVIADSQDSTLIIVKRIDIHGNEKTKNSIVLRELSFDTNRVYTLKEFLEYHIPRSTSNIKYLDLFNQINITYHMDSTTSPANTYLNIELVEKWYLWPIPFVEFADRNFNQWYSLKLEPYRTNFGLYVFKNNFRGMNHTIKLTLGTGYTHTVGLEIVAPYVDRKKRIGLGLDLRHKTNNEIQYGVLDNRELFYRDKSRTMIITRSAEGSIQYRPKLYLKQTLIAGYSRIDISDTVLSDGLNPDFTLSELTQQKASCSYVIEYDKQNNNQFPTSGAYISASTGYHRLLSSSVDYVSAGVHASYIKRFGNPEKKRFSAGVSGVMNYISEEKLPYNLSKALGYDDYVRGYEENIFLGNSYGVLKSELRYHIINERIFHLRYMPVRPYKDMATESYLSIFLDQGYAYYRGQKQVLTGYGIGLNSLFYFDKVLRFEYSWDRNGNSGLKVHFKKSF